MSERAVKILIFGQVQRVGFRKFIKNHSLELGLIGTVENLEDGRVQVFAKGDKVAVGKLIYFCEQGPQRAIIEKVEVKDIDLNDEIFDLLTSFTVHHN